MSLITALAGNMVALSDIEALSLRLDDEVFLSNMPQVNPEKREPWFHSEISIVTAGELRARMGQEADEDSRRRALMVKEMRARGYADCRDYSQVRRELIKVVN